MRFSTRFSRTRRLQVTGLLGATSLLIAACAGSPDPATDPEEVIELKMAVAPSATFAPVFVGVETGIFEEHGIDLELDVGGLAPTTLPRLLQGEIDLAASTWGSLVTARAEKLPLVGVAGIDRGGDTPEDDYQGIMVGEDGPTSLKELEGKTIGVPSLQSFTDAQVRSLLEAEGVDTDTIRFLAVGFPDMPNALSSGQVDAVGVVEPFKTIIEQQGGEALSTLSRSQLMGSVLASEQFVEENPEKLERFLAAWQETLEYTAENEDDVRSALVSGFDIEEDLASEITLPIWITSDVAPDDVQEIADMLAEVDMVSDTIPSSELMAEM